MSITAFEFAAFFAVLLTLYYLFSPSLRPKLILAASIVFMLSYGLNALIFVMISTLSSYFFALKLQKSIIEEGDFVLNRENSREKNKADKKIYKRKRAFLLLLSFLPNIGVLLFFKLSAPFALSEHFSLIIPIGLSFYSLRAVSYLCDVYRGKESAERSLWKFTLYMTYFPLILQGPVVRLSQISDKLFRPHAARWENIMSGILRISFGIFKKLVIANGLSTVNANIAWDSINFDGVYVVILLCLYSAEIYSDFSGGIDIMLGISLSLGISLPENFDRPFSSVSVREYWNRWHITLGEWFESYVFYPISLSKPMQRLSKFCRKRLGKNIGKRIPLYISTLTVWILTGLWHGSSANYLVWGALNGILVLVSREAQPFCTRLRGIVLGEAPSGKVSFLLTVFGRVRTFFLIGALRLLDVYRDVPLTFRMLGSVFYDRESYINLFTPEALKPIVGLTESAVPILGCLILLLVGEVSAKCRCNSSDRWGFRAASSVSDQAENEICSLSSRISARPYICVLCISLLLCLSLIFGRYGVGFDSSDFIYSQF